MCRKLYLQSIKALPEKYIDEETRITTLDTEKVIVANPKYTPMIFKDDKWTKITFDKGDKQ